MKKEARFKNLAFSIQGGISLSKRLKLYYIDDKYIDFLRKYDSRVAYNKNETRLI